MREPLSVSAVFRPCRWVYLAVFLWDLVWQHSTTGFIRLNCQTHCHFFGGSRFVPIISTVTYVGIGILMYFIWPAVQNGIFALGGLVTGTGYFGTLIFGIVKRALIPFGLHHVFYMPFWQTAVGGTMMVDGNLIQGGQNIFFAQLAFVRCDAFQRGCYPVFFR